MNSNKLKLEDFPILTLPKYGERFVLPTMGIWGRAEENNIYYPIHMILYNVNRVYSFNLSEKQEQRLLSRILMFISEIFELAEKQVLFNEWYRRKTQEGITTEPPYKKEELLLERRRLEYYRYMEIVSMLDSAEKGKLND